MLIHALKHQEKKKYATSCPSMVLTETRSKGVTEHDKKLLKIYKEQFKKLLNIVHKITCLQNYNLSRHNHITVANKKEFIGYFTEFI